MESALSIDRPALVEEVEKGLSTYIHVSDDQGRIILSKKANTILSNFYRVLYMHMSHGKADFRDTGGATRGGSRNNENFQVKAPAGEAAWGIVLGTSTAAVSITDYNLGATIPHGTGAGQLLYGSTDVTDIEIIGNMARFYITRLFTNDGGADITVNEIGLIVRVHDGFPLYSVLIDRTLATFIVPAGGSRNVIYELRVVA